MPGLGFAEMLFIFVAALLLFGPRRLPELGRTLGKGLAEFRRASSELRRTLDAEGLEQDLRETRETIRSVDPRRYVKEAMMSDEAAGRVERTKRPAREASEQEDGEQEATTADAADGASAAPQDTVARGSKVTPRASDGADEATATNAGEAASVSASAEP